MSTRSAHLASHVRRHGIAYAALTVAFSFSPVPSMAADLVTTAEIENGAVTTPKLGADSVVSGKILNATVSGADIKDNSVTYRDLVDGTIGWEDVAAESIDGGHIANGTLSGADIAEGSIGTADLAASARAPQVTRYEVGSHDFALGATRDFQLPGTWNADLVTRSQWSATMYNQLTHTAVVVPSNEFRLAITETGVARISYVGTQAPLAYFFIRLYQTTPAGS